MIDAHLADALTKENDAQASIHLNPVNPEPDKNGAQVLIGTPTLGTVRIEWHNAMRGMVMPPNWAAIYSTPGGYTVADAQNLLVDTALRVPTVRALILIEDDTCPPPHAMIVFDRWFWKMERKKCPPIVSGVYHIKASAEVREGATGGVELLGPEPLIYRGSGQRAYRDFKYGDVVACSGVPTGALLVHKAVLEAWAREADLETYMVPGYPYPLKRIFQNPSHVWYDASTGAASASVGTSDLWWSAETIKRDILTKAGWPDEWAKQEYPFFVDTSIRFAHIDRATGVQY